MNSKKWTDMQEAIFDAGVKAEASYRVNGVAGCGKTSTIEEMLRRRIEHNASYPGRYICFGRANADEAKKRMPLDVKVSTYHSAGYQALRQVVSRLGRADSRKTEHIAKDLFPNLEYTEILTICKAVEVAKNSNLSPFDEDNISSMVGIMETHEVPADPDRFEDIAPLAFEVLGESLAAVKDDGHIDFSDMLWAPLQMHAPFSKVPFLVVDEYQDTNSVQEEMIAHMLSSNGKLFCVGDPNQSIYAFRGANTDAMDRATKRFGLEELPLSVSFRCPRSVVRVCQNFVPRMEWSEFAEEGLVSYRGHEWQPRLLDSQCLVVCRLNRPLLLLAHLLLAERRPFTIRNRGMKESLLSLLQRSVGGKKLEDVFDMSMDQASGRIKDFVTREAEKLKRRKMLGQLANMQDNANSLIDLGSTCATVRDLVQLLEAIFLPGAGVQLSTVHGAKGLEAPHVFVLNDYLMPFTFADSLDDVDPKTLQQERNLQYVAYSRPLETLNFIDLERE